MQRLRGLVIDNGEASADGMEQYLREGASGSLASEFNGFVVGFFVMVVVTNSRR